MTKVNIISGFLGAGKTTFIKKLIAEVFAGEKLVLIENEFGEIGVDGGFLQQAGIEITEMNSGCICCSLVGDFTEALKKTVETYAPDRIIIEPSGVGKLSDVIAAVNNTGDENIRVDSCITVVDCLKCKIYSKNFGEFYENQISNSNCVLLTRVDKASEEKINQAMGIIRGINKDANIITTQLDLLSPSQILDAFNKGSLEAELLSQAHHHHEHGEGCTCGCHEHRHEHHHEHHHEHGEECTCGCHGHHHEHAHHNHHADEAFVSWGFETVKKYSEKEIENILSELDSEEYGIVLRAKGMVASEKGWVYFDYVPGESDVRSGDACYTGKICVIGADLNQEKLAELFGKEI